MKVMPSKFICANLTPEVQIWAVVEFFILATDEAGKAANEFFKEVHSY